MITFRELLHTEGYDWDLYFYRLEAKNTRSSLEDLLLRSYHKIKGTKNVELCCCDTGPIALCGPECCTQVSCFHCTATIRICKDAWFCYDSVALCMRCNKKREPLLV
jgi:hypothetical protein